MSNIRNLVFSGAGVDGAGFVGAARELEKVLGGSFQQIERVAGTSSGSIMALMVALNLNAAEIEKLYMGLNFVKVADCQFFINEAANIIRHDSIYDGDMLRQLIMGLIVKSHYPADITFAELKKRKGKDLHIVTSKTFECDGNGAAEPQIFCAEKTPNTSIFLAVLASASIPGLFPPVYLEEDKNAEGRLIENKSGFPHVDGAFTLNLAVNIFDKKKYDPTQLIAGARPEDYYFNHQTLAFLVASPQQIQDIKNKKPNIKTIPPHHPVTFFTALLYGATLGKQYLEFLHSKNEQRTILINDENISSINFDITLNQKMQLIQSGEKAVQNFYRLPDAPKNFRQAPRIAGNPALKSSPLHKQAAKKPLKAREETCENDQQKRNNCIIL